jgi:hypothetical protein
MNGSYSLADTPADRIAVAAVSANVAYFERFKEGVSPGYGWYADFFKPFIECEIKQALLNRLHVNTRAEELALVEEVRQLRQICQDKIKANHKQAAEGT